MMMIGFNRPLSSAAIAKEYLREQRNATARLNHSDIQAALAYMTDRQSGYVAQ